MIFLIWIIHLQSGVQFSSHIEWLWLLVWIFNFPSSVINIHATTHELILCALPCLCFSKVAGALTYIIYIWICMIYIHMYTHTPHRPGYGFDLVLVLHCHAIHFLTSVVVYLWICTSNYWWPRICTLNLYIFWRCFSIHFLFWMLLFFGHILATCDELLYVLWIWCIFYNWVVVIHSPFWLLLFPWVDDPCLYLFVCLLLSRFPIFSTGSYTLRHMVKWYCYSTAPLWSLEIFIPVYGSLVNDAL